MKISEFQIDRYGPIRGLNINCNKDIQVIYGPNESGKTLLLEALLKLFDPNISNTIKKIDRIPDSPAGYVVLESNEKEWMIGKDYVLNDITPIDSIHLRNIFVVRDNDLRMKNQHQFYDSVTEQIGDIHTSEIEEIRSRFEELGRLTKTTRKISSASKYNNAGEIYDESKNLANEIRDYVEEKREEDIDKLEGELIQVQTEIKETKRDLRIQKNAKKAAEHSVLSERLSTIKKTTEELDNLTDISRETLEKLTSLKQEINSYVKRKQELNNKIKTLEEKINDYKEKLEKIKDELAPLEKREKQIDEVSNKLEKFHEIEDKSIGAKKVMRFSKIIAGSGIGFGGVTTFWSVIQEGNLIILPVILLIIGVIGIILYIHKYRQFKKFEEVRNSLLRKARNARLKIESVSDIAPAIGKFSDDLEMKQNNKTKLDKNLNAKQEVIKERREELDELIEKIDDERENKNKILQDAEVSTVEEYRQEVRRKEEIQDKISPAKQSLIDEFGEPPEESWDTKIEFWQNKLQEFVEEIDLEEVDPNEYDEDTHSKLKAKLEELEERIYEIEQKLDEHNRKIEEYKRRIQNINARDFIDEDISLEAETTDGLARLIEDLKKLANKIERDAEISRKALEIFNELHEEEEEKIADLFEPSGRTSQIFKEITEDRYQEVKYDNNEKTLKVKKDTEELTAEELSHATKQQLYLSARISLAEKLLGGEPGFFLMDEAFLPSDRERLTNQFQILQNLVGEGWQIIYLTAKKEVKEDMVDEFDLKCAEFERRLP